MSDREVEDFNKGFIYEKTKDILTKGHVTVLATARVENVLSRAQFSNYPIPLNKYKFEKMVKVLAMTLKFINMKTKGKFSEKMKCGIKFQAFSVTLIDDDKVPAECKSLLDLLKASDPFIGIKKARDPFIGISFGCKDPDVKFLGKHQVELTEEDISRALYYLFEKATAELKHFQKKELLDKISVEKEGILMCKSRLLEGQRLMEAGGLESMEILKDLNLNFCTPMVDRYSPLAYALADYIHRVSAKHAGYENSYRLAGHLEIRRTSTPKPQN